MLELRGGSSLKKTSLSKGFLEDSFNDLLENSNILEELENEANEKVVVNPPRPSENAESAPGTTLKLAIDDNITTPPNNLVIKTKNITPCPNYDEMNTPSVIRELEKFGLKPLKRRRGIKLLKYLYECTHPLVGSDEVELSSDEDDRKVVKKRKKTNRSESSGNYIKIRKNTFRCDQENIEIVGDALLKK